MADYKVGQCNYCGKYRELKYYGGYCCKSCYQKSGQAAKDAKDAQDKEELWYERDDVLAVLIRTVVMTIGWMIFAGICDYKFGTSISDYMIVVAPVVSLLQNFIMRDKEKPFRCFILYGIPIVLFLILSLVVGHLNKVKANNKEMVKKYETSLQYADWARLKGTSGLTEEKIEKELLKTLKKPKDIDNGKIKSDFDKWYSSDYNCFVAQEYAYYEYSLKEQKLKPKSSVLFDNNGLAFDKYKYYPGAGLKSINGENRGLTVEFNPKTKRSYYYWKDGTVIYNLPGEVYVKKDAVFNTKNATEVVGKTFSGRWKNVKDKASITFGNDGVATVVLPDGKKTKGAYFASDEDNMVVYNHNNEGIWYSFHYYDNTPLVSFYAYDEDLTKFKEIGVNAWKKID